jgi:hypothetical protein
VRFSLDRRWGTLAVAVLLGAGGGSLLGFLTAPGDGAVRHLAPVEQPASSTTRRPRGRFAGVTSTTHARARAFPAATAGSRPATTATPTSSTVRPTTTARPTTSITAGSTTTSGATTTTTAGGTTTTSPGGPSSTAPTT